MNSKRLRKIFDTIKNERRGGAPREGWVESNREILMMQVRNTTDRQTRSQLLGKVRHLFAIFFPVEPAMAFARAAAVFLLVIGTVVGGGLASASVYKDALPGDRMYGLKLAVEKAEIALAPNQDYRTSLHADFADRRMEEAAALAEGSVSRYRYLPDVLSAFNAEVGAMESGVESLRTEDRAGAVALAKRVEGRLSTYRTTMSQVAMLLPGSYRRSLDASRDLVDATSIKAMAVIVVHHRAGDEEASQAVVASNFEEHLNQAEAKLQNKSKTASAQTTKAKAVIAEAKELVTEGKYEAALSKMVEVVELTKEVENADAAAVAPPATTAGETGVTAP